MDFPLGGDVFISKSFPDNILLLLHEIGHAIGLKHPWEGDPVLAADEFTSQFTLYAGGRTTLGPLDIEAAQFLYGLPSADGTQVASWSWDSSLYTLTQNGTDLSDLIRGVSTNDVIFGNGGDDTIRGNAGDDVLDGGAGVDTMAGGTGNDIYVVDNVGDQIVENSNEGNDLINASVNYTLPANVEALVLCWEQARSSAPEMARIITSVEMSDSNIIDGGLGADYMVGGQGNDIYTSTIQATPSSKIRMRATTSSTPRSTIRSGPISNR